MDELETPAYVPRSFEDDVAQIPALIEYLSKNQVEEARVILEHLHHSTVAHFLSTTAPELLETALMIMADRFDPDILLALSHGMCEYVIRVLGEEVVAKIIAPIELHDIVYILEDLDPPLIHTLLGYLPEEVRRAVRERLSYPDDSAGRLMRRKTVSVMIHWNVGQVIDYLRYNKTIPDEFYEVFILNDRYQPIGAVAACKILCSMRETPIATIMNEDFRTISAFEEEEEVSHIFKQYELTSAPVVNEQGRLVGVLFLDDIVEIIDKEAGEDILRLGGVGEADMHASFWETATHRLPWLIANLLIAILACSVIRMFDEVIARVVILASIMPVVTSMGGSAGTQTLTVAVRALATKELTPMNAWRTINKELCANLVSALVIGCIGGGIIWALHHDLRIAMVLVTALVINVTIAGLSGITIPLILHKLGADPAVSTNVFVCAITDMAGFFFFLFLAKPIVLSG